MLDWSTVKPGEIYARPAYITNPFYYLFIISNREGTVRYSYNYGAEIGISFLRDLDSKFVKISSHNILTAVLMLSNEHERQYLLDKFIRMVDPG